MLHKKTDPKCKHYKNKNTIVNSFAYCEIFLTDYWTVSSLNPVSYLL